MVSSHGAHGVATGDEYCIEIMANYRYMLLSCAITFHEILGYARWSALGSSGWEED